MLTKWYPSVSSLLLCLVKYLFITVFNNGAFSPIFVASKSCQGAFSASEQLLYSPRSAAFGIMPPKMLNVLIFALSWNPLFHLAAVWWLLLGMNSPELLHLNLLNIHYYFRVRIICCFGNTWNVRNRRRLMKMDINEKYYAFISLVGPVMSSYLWVEKQLPVSINFMERIVSFSLRQICFSFATAFF